MVIKNTHKIPLLLLCTFVLVTGVPFFPFAQSNKDITSKTIVQWKFTPKTSTAVGFNIDTATIGMAGVAQLSAEYLISKKHTEEFTNDGSEVYARITLKNVQIRFYKEKQTQTNEKDSTTNNNSIAPYITYDRINGIIYLGPVYINLANILHDTIKIQNTTNDFIPYSVISTDIIPISTTSGYLESSLLYSNKENNSYKKNPTPSFKYEPTKTFFKTIPSSLGLSIGILIKEYFDFRLGITTMYSYAQSIPFNYNPLSLSLFFSLLGIKNLSFFIHSGITTGINGYNTFDIDNPLTIIMFSSYTFNLPSISLTPLLGVQFKHIVMKSINQNESETGKFLYQFVDTNKVSIIPINIFELRAGIKLKWKPLQKTQEKGNYLDLNGTTQEYVTDGISLTFIYGNDVHYIFRQTIVPYLGVKLALWESESTLNTGIVQGWKAGIILNINHSQGGFVENISGLKTSYTSVRLESRTDLGLGLETEVSISFFKIRIGIISKVFDIFDKKTIIKNIGLNFPMKRVYPNRIDVRTFIGLSIVKIIPNTTFELLWQTGDLYKDKTEYSVTTTKIDDNFFRIQNNSHSYSFPSDNTWGYISLSATITF